MSKGRSVHPDVIEANKKKKEQEEKSKGRSISVSTPLPSMFLPLGSVVLSQSGMSTSRSSPTSTESDSPRSSSPSSDRAPSTGRRRSNSHVKTIHILRGSLGSPSSPRISSKKDSPRLEIKRLLQTVFKGEMPISDEEAELIIKSAESKYNEYMNESKYAKELVKACKENGLSFSVCIKVKDHEENYTVVVTSHHHAEPEIYLVDTTKKMGEGADAYIFAAYHLKSGVKVAARVLNNTHARKNHSQIYNEMITRLIVTKRFNGLFYGDIHVASTYVIFIPWAPGKILTEWLYQTHAPIKVAFPDCYKDIPEYFAEKISHPFEKRFDMAVALSQALLEVHACQFVHLDGSPDNYLIEEKKEGFHATLVDVDSGVDMGCDIFSAQVEVSKQALYDLPFDSNAAYVRVDDELRYLNKHNNRTFLFVKKGELEGFDDQFKVSGTPRRLSTNELEEMEKLTGQPHKFPLMSGGLSAAFGYAPRELIERNTSSPYSYQSDFYMLAVLLLDIFSCENIQREMKVFFKKKVEKEGHRPELSAAELKSFAPSMFDKYYLVKLFNLEKNFSVNPRLIDEYVCHFVYYRAVAPKVRELLGELLSDTPKNRLRHSDLTGLIKRFLDLQKLLASLTGMVKHALSSLTSERVMMVICMVNALAILQDLGLSLKKLIPFLNDGALDLKKLLVEIKKDEPITSPDWHIAVKLNQAAEKEYLYKRSVAYDVVIGLKVSWDDLKDSPSSLKALETLGSCILNTRQSPEFIDFMKELLRPLLNKEEKSGPRR